MRCSGWDVEGNIDLYWFVLDPSQWENAYLFKVDLEKKEKKTEAQ